MTLKAFEPKLLLKRQENHIYPNEFNDFVALPTMD